jgi:hypothetical protein
MGCKTAQKAEIRPPIGFEFKSLRRGRSQIAQLAY